jgi:hypothetical protein
MSAWACRWDQPGDEDGAIETDGERTYGEDPKDGHGVAVPMSSMEM